MNVITKDSFSQQNFQNYLKSQSGFFNYRDIANAAPPYSAPLCENLFKTISNYTGEDDELLKYFFPDGILINQLYFQVETGIYILTSGQFIDMKNLCVGWWPILFMQKYKKSFLQSAVYILVKMKEFGYNQATDILSNISNFVDDRQITREILKRGFREIQKEKTPATIPHNSDLTPLKKRLKEYLNRKNIFYNPHTKLFRCPGHEDKNPSAILYDKQNIPVLYCPVCGRSFDVFNVAGLLCGTNNFKEQIQEVKKVLYVMEKAV